MIPRLAALAAAFALSAAILRAGDAATGGASPDAARSLYVRSGPTAQRLFLSFDSLAADVYWMRTIQHYGRDRRSIRQGSRFELLFPLLDLTTSLDPQFNIAYRFGSVFLAERPPSGPGRVDQAIALLEKGLRANPDRWHYAFDIGFIYYWHGTGVDSDFSNAAAWFDRAAAMPGAPLWVKPLAATTRAQGGDRAGAASLLQELANSEEEWVRRAARRGLEQLQAADTINRLQRALDAYEAAHQRAPGSWTDLDPAAPPGAVPIDPAGAPFEFDRAAHRIVLSSKSPLAPLPRSLVKR